MQAFTNKGYETKEPKDHTSTHLIVRARMNVGEV